MPDDHYRGLVYRAHDPCWSFSPLSGDGAKRRGGRFNPKGIAALYTALSQTVALAEYHQGFPHRPQPTTLCAYEVDCKDVVDLTDPGMRRLWGCTDEDLACPWEILAAAGKAPPSWMLARRLMAEGVAAIIVPSFAINAPASGKNLVFWLWDQIPPHQVRLIDDNDALPRDQASWNNCPPGPG